MPAQFKVMTWNVENLFGPVGTDGVRRKIESLAGTILDLDPDIVALQEVGGQEAFDALQAALDGRYPHQALPAHPDPRGIRVGFLSKLPIEESEDVLDFPDGALQAVPGVDGDGNPTTSTRPGRGALRILVRPTAVVRSTC